MIFVVDVSQELKKIIFFQFLNLAELYFQKHGSTALLTLWVAIFGQHTNIHGRCGQHDGCGLFKFHCG